MAIMPIGNNGVLPFGGIIGRNFGALTVAVVALNVLSNLPTAAAKQVSNTEKEICKTICSPLPGDDKGAPEKICQEVCTLSGVITKTKEWVEDRAGNLLKTVAPSLPIIGGTVECAALCAQGPFTAVSNTFEAAWAAFKGNYARAVVKTADAAAKTLCAAIGYTPAGMPGCLACCAAVMVGEKVSGTVVG